MLAKNLCTFDNIINDAPMHRLFIVYFIRLTISLALHSLITALLLFGVAYLIARKKMQLNKLGADIALLLFWGTDCVRGFYPFDFTSRLNF